MIRLLIVTFLLLAQSAEAKVVRYDGDQRAATEGTSYTVFDANGEIVKAGASKTGCDKYARNGGRCEPEAR